MLWTATADRPTTFLILFVGEGLSWAGVPALGTAAIGGAGALASQGVIHLWAVLVVGTIAAELGGMVGWWIGRRAAGAGYEHDGRFADRRRSALTAGERFAHRWGRLMVFFVPSWVPGALGMPFGQFARWNILAAALWNLGAGLSAYGLTSAATGGELWESVLPLAVAGLALAAIVVLVVRHHRRRPGVSRPGLHPDRVT